MPHKISIFDLMVLPLGRGRIVTSEPLSWVWGTSHVIPAASSRGLSDGGSGVGESVACNDSRLCTSSCCLCGNRWEYVLSVVDTFSCPSLSANISASQPWLISKLACECLTSWIRIFFTPVFCNLLSSRVRDMILLPGTAFHLRQAYTLTGYSLIAPGRENPESESFAYFFLS